MAQQTFEEIAAAVKQAESGGKRYKDDGKTLTTSAKGALGEMQVMPKTIRDPGYGVVPARDKSPDEIARVGRDYLQAMLGKYGDMDKALAAYNWGPGSTDKWIAAGAKLEKLPEETRTYIQRVKGFLEDKPVTAGVSREAPAPRKALPPSLPPMAAAVPGAAPAAPALDMKQQVASLGPGYQAALALSFLSDTDDKEDRDTEREPGIAEQFMAQTASRPSALAQFADFKIRSPFAEPQPPVRMAGGGEASSSKSNYHPDVQKALNEGRISAREAALYNPLYSTRGDPSIGSGGVRDGASEQKMNYLRDIKSGKQAMPEGWRIGAPEGFKAPVRSQPLDLSREQLRSMNIAAPRLGGISEYANTYPAGGSDSSYRRELLQALKESPDYQPYIEELNRLDRKDTVDPVKMAGGGEVTQEEIDAASRPAFITPGSGIGRKQGPISNALASGEGYVEFAKGLTNIPQNLVGAPMDISNMIANAFGGGVEKPIGGSEYIKEALRKRGLGFTPSTDPTLAGFYAAGDLGSNLVNPAGATRAGVKAAGKTGEAAKMLAQDFQQYNQQLAVPGASYAVRNKGTPFMMGYERTQGPDGKFPAIDQAAKYIKQDVAVTGDPKLNDWLSNKLTSYLRRDFATPDDQFVKAADANQLLHFVNKPVKNRPDLDPYYKRINDSSYIGSLPYVRKTEGFEPQGVAKTEYGKRAEALTDASAWPVQLEDITSPGMIPRGMDRTDPSARLTELGASVDEMLQFDKLAADMERMRSMPKTYSAYSQPAIKVPEEYLLTDEALIGLTPAQASNRVARFRNWEEESRQRMASKFAKEDPRLSREELPGKFTAVALPDLQKSPEIKQLAMDVGCDGNWCTKEQSSALDYGSGDSRLHIILDEKARPMAQITFTRLPPTKRQLEADPSADDRFSITELLGKDNSKDFSKNPALPAIQQYIKLLDRRHDLRFMTNLNEIGMKELSIEDTMRGAKELSDRRQRYKPGVDPGEYLAASERDFNDFKTAIQGVNGGSKYLTKDQDVDLLIQQALERLVPQQRATGGMIERQSTDNRRYM